MRVSDRNGTDESGGRPRSQLKIQQSSYVFEGLDGRGAVTAVRLSELFRPGTESVAIYNYMFPRHAGDDRPGPSSGESGKLPQAEGPCPSCTALIDQLDAAEPHVAAHANLIVVAKAPIDRVATFGRERGWRNIRLLSWDEQLDYDCCH